MPTASFVSRNTVARSGSSVLWLVSRYTCRQHTAVKPDQTPSATSRLHRHPVAYGDLRGASPREVDYFCTSCQHPSCTGHFVCGTVERTDNSSTDRFEAFGGSQQENCSSRINRSIRRSGPKRCR